MEYRIIQLDTGSYLLQIKEYLKEKWWSCTPEIIWHDVKYAHTIKDLKKFIEDHKGCSWARRHGDLVPIIDRGII